MKRWLLLVVGLIVALIVLVLTAPTASGQKIGQEKRPAESAKLKRVAVMPMAFQEGQQTAKNEEATGTYRTALLGALEKLGLEVIDPGKVNAAWRGLTGELFDPTKFALPSPAALISLGKELAADFVVVSRCSWRVRSLWVGVGPKTKAHARVDLWIVDVARSEFSLKAENVLSDSTEREPGWKTAVTILVLPVSFVSGGPKTPHLKRSGVLSLMKALEPWAEKQSPNSIKITADK